MATILERIQYGFDRDSRRTWRRRALATGEDYHYNYDRLSQVVASDRGNLNLNCSAIAAEPVHAESWAYDPTGNWHGYHVEENGAVVLEQDRHHDKGNRLTQIKGEANPLLLDRAGRMIQASPDASGNWDEPLRFKWDAWSRLTEVRRASDGTVLGKYGYDGLGRRITREIASVVHHSYYSASWKPLEERQGSGAAASVQYLWGARHRDDLVRCDRDSDGGGTLDETRYVLMDYFSPAAITDEEGAVTERYDFTAFGTRRILHANFTPRSSSECAFEFSFQGQFVDTESGMQNYGYRYYSPYLGRWLCKDPIEEDGGVNLYAFADNCPVSILDHFGLIAVDFTGADTDPGFTKANDFTKGAGWTDYNGSINCWCTCKEGKEVASCVASLTAVVTINYGYNGLEDLGRGRFDPDTVYGHEQRHIQARNREVEEKLYDALGTREDTFDSAQECNTAAGEAESAGQAIIDSLKGGGLSPPHGPGSAPGSPKSGKPYNPLPGSTNQPPPSDRFPNAKPPLFPGANPPGGPPPF